MIQQKSSKHEMYYKIADFNYVVSSPIEIYGIHTGYL